MVPHSHGRDNSSSSPPSIRQPNVSGLKRLDPQPFIEENKIKIYDILYRNRMELYSSFHPSPTPALGHPSSSWEPPKAPRTGLGGDLTPPLPGVGTPIQFLGAAEGLQDGPGNGFDPSPTQSNPAVRARIPPSPCPDPPQDGPRTPRSHPRAAQEPFKPPTEPPRSSPGAPQDPTRSPPGAPRRPPGAPRSPQETPHEPPRNLPGDPRARRSQSNPAESQNGMRRTPDFGDSAREGCNFQASRRAPAPL